MTSLTFKSILSGSVLAAISGLAMMTQAGTASANVLYCEGTGRQSVVECCQTQVKMNGLPLWMKQTGRSCTQVVSCYKYDRRCKVQVTYFDQGNKQDKGGQRGGRGKN